MARGGSRDGRETFLLDTVRLRVKPSVPKAPQANSVEFYHRDGAFYWLDSSGVEHTFVTQDTIGTSGIEVQENNVVIVAAASKLNFDANFTVTDSGGNKATISINPEITQDTVATMFEDTTDIFWTYDDPAGILTASLNLTGVTAGIYGGPTITNQFTVDSKGRISSVTQWPILAVNVGYTPSGDLTAIDVQTALDELAIDQFSWEHIPGLTTVTIPVNRQMVVAGFLTLDGILYLDGSLAVIP